MHWANPSLWTSPTIAHHFARRMCSSVPRPTTSLPVISHSHFRGTRSGITRCTTLWTQSRLYQNTASQPPGSPTPPPIKSDSRSSPKASHDLSGDAVHPSVAEQRKTDWGIIKRLLKHIWPDNDWATRSRVVLGFGLLVAGKVRTLTSVRYRYL